MVQGEVDDLSEAKLVLIHLTWQSPSLATHIKITLIQTILENVFAVRVNKLGDLD